MIFRYCTSVFSDLGIFRIGVRFLVMNSIYINFAVRLDNVILVLVTLW